MDHTMKWKLRGEAMDALKTARHGGHAECVELVEVRRRLDKECLCSLAQAGCYNAVVAG